MAARRALSLATALLVAATLVLAAVPAARADDRIVTVKGGGWGHGVGMSQYGAYGQALEGRGYAAILASYYRGSRLGTVGVDVADPGNLWVNLALDKKGLELRPKAIRSGAVPAVVTRGTESVTVPTGHVIFVEVDTGGSCTVATAVDGQAPAQAMGPGSCSMEIDWDGDTPDPSTRIEVTRTRGSGNWSACTRRDWNEGLDRPCAYSRGRMHIRPDGNFASNPAVHLVVEVAVDAYVLGISEMPYYWGQQTVALDTPLDPKGMEALKTQAVAARSYALARAKLRGNPADRQQCWCHLYDTPRDQNYVGWGHGKPSWITASNATAGQVLIHDDVRDVSTGGHLPLEAFYSSSTFGRSEPNEAGFDPPARPYLRSEDDHWAANPSLNPNAKWAKTFTVDELAGILGMTTLTGVSVVKISDSGAIETLRFHGTPADVVRHTRFLRTPLGIKSPQITAVDFPSSPPPPTTPPPTTPPPAGSSETVGLHDPRTGVFTLRSSTIAPFYFGNPADIPYAGDWNCDGVTTLGLYRVSTGFLFLRNSNTQGIADIEIYYGDPGDLPIAGDWDGDGCETVGIFRPSEGRFYLRNTNTQGIADTSAVFGRAGDVPIAGDWDGDGRDSFGVYRPSTKTVLLANSITDPRVDVEFAYTGAEPGDRIVAGDWDGDGDDTVGVFRPSDRTFYLRDTFSQPSANVVIQLGAAHMTPVAGNWGG